jgi:2-keto-4-pentenoate hydratase/2-oxohepta-3-ene-1,7-dioic acid hydratase in catechol pathway
MLFTIPELISYVSSIMRLEPMDFIMTGKYNVSFLGTPAGVGPLLPGDTVHAGVTGDITTLKFHVAVRPETLRHF